MHRLSTLGIIPALGAAFVAPPAAVSAGPRRGPHRHWIAGHYAGHGHYRRWVAGHCT